MDFFLSLFEELRRGGIVFHSPSGRGPHDLAGQERVKEEKDRGKEEGCWAPAAVRELFNESHM